MCALTVVAMLYPKKYCSLLKLFMKLVSMLAPHNLVFYMNMVHNIFGMSQKMLLAIKKKIS